MVAATMNEQLERTRWAVESDEAIQINQSFVCMFVYSSLALHLAISNTFAHTSERVSIASSSIHEATTSRSLGSFSYSTKNDNNDHSGGASPREAA